MPVTIGRREPISHAPYNCRQVPRPATNRPAWITVADCCASMFAADATMKIGARFATNMAITCCSPNGMPRQNAIGASKLLSASNEMPEVVLVFFSLIVSPLARAQ